MVINELIMKTAAYKKLTQLINLLYEVGCEYRRLFGIVILHNFPHVRDTYNDK